MKNKYFFFIVLVVLFIAFLISLGIYYVQKPLIVYKDSTKNVIFTSKKHEIYSQEVPQVNLVGNDIQAINDNIILFVEDYYGKNGVSIGYDYSKNGTVLSLLVTIISKNAIESPEVLFTSYHISLKDNRIISDEELLLKNGFSISDVEKLVDDAFLEYYFQSDISRYCDLDCFHNDLGKYYQFNPDVSLYVIDGEIRAYVSLHERMEYLAYQYFYNRNYYLRVGDALVW